MQSIIGQKRIISMIDSWKASNSLPHFIMLVGSKGAGKRLLTEYIAEDFAIIDTVAQNKVDNIRELIESAQQLSKPRIFQIVEAETMTVQAQNALLKVAEEPSKNAYIIMTVVDINSILPTIKSRATIVELQPYTKDELLEFSENGLLVSLCDTPGEILDMEFYPFKKMIQYAEKVKMNLSKVVIGNMFKITESIDFGDSRSGDYAVEYFLKALLMQYMGDFPILSIISKARSDMKYRGADKREIFDSMLLLIRREEACRKVK